MTENVGRLEIEASLRDGVSQGLKQIQSGVIRLAGAITAAMALISGVGFPVRQAVEYERALANIAKTTGFTAQQINRVGDALLLMSRESSRSALDLASIATVAGQLGLGDRAGVQGIIEFTRVIQMAATALNVLEEEAAKMGAQILNIFKYDPSQTENILSVINELSNTSVARGEEIADIVARIGTIAGLAFPQVAALGAYAKDLGVSTEVAGTSFVKIFTRMLSSAEAFAELMNITTEEWVSRIQDDAVEALKDATEAVSKLGAAAQAGAINRLFGQGRVYALTAKVVEDAANNFVLLDQHVATANQQFIEGTSIAREFAAVMGTTEEQVRQTGNTLAELAVRSGDQSLPLIREMLSAVREWAMRPETQEMAIDFGNEIRKIIVFVQRLGQAIAGLGIDWSKLYRLLQLILVLIGVRLVAGFASFLVAKKAGLTAIAAMWGRAQAAILGYQASLDKATTSILTFGAASASAAAKAQTAFTAAATRLTGAAGAATAPNLRQQLESQRLAVLLGKEKLQNLKAQLNTERQNLAAMREGTGIRANAVAQQASLVAHLEKQVKAQGALNRKMGGAVRGVDQKFARDDPQRLAALAAAEQKASQQRLDGLQKERAANMGVVGAIQKRADVQGRISASDMQRLNIAQANVRTLDSQIAAEQKNAAALGQTSRQYAAVAAQTQSAAKGMTLVTDRGGDMLRQSQQTNQQLGATPGIIGKITGSAGRAFTAIGSFFRVLLLPSLALGAAFMALTFLAGKAFDMFVRAGNERKRLARIERAAERQRLVDLQNSYDAAVEIYNRLVGEATIAGKRIGELMSPTLALEVPILDELGDVSFGKAVSDITEVNKAITGFRAGIEQAGRSIEELEAALEALAQERSRALLRQGEEVYQTGMNDEMRQRHAAEMEEFDSRARFLRDQIALRGQMQNELEQQIQQMDRIADIRVDQLFQALGSGDVFAGAALSVGSDYLEELKKNIDQQKEALLTFFRELLQQEDLKLEDLTPQFVGALEGANRAAVENGLRALKVLEDEFNLLQDRLSRATETEGIGISVQIRNIDSVLGALEEEVEETRDRITAILGDVRIEDIDGKFLLGLEESVAEEVGSALDRLRELERARDALTRDRVVISGESQLQQQGAMFVPLLFDLAAADKSLIEARERWENIIQNVNTQIEVDLDTTAGQADLRDFASQIKDFAAFGDDEITGAESFIAVIDQLSAQLANAGNTADETRQKLIAMALTSPELANILPKIIADESGQTALAIAERLTQAARERLKEESQLTREEQERLPMLRAAIDIREQELALEARRETAANRLSALMQEQERLLARRAELAGDSAAAEDGVTESVNRQKVSVQELIWMMESSPEIDVRVEGIQNFRELAESAAGTVDAVGEMVLSTGEKVQISLKDGVVSLSEASKEGAKEVESAMSRIDQLRQQDLEFAIDFNVGQIENAEQAIRTVDAALERLSSEYDNIDFGFSMGGLTDDEAEAFLSRIEQDLGNIRSANRQGVDDYRQQARYAKETLNSISAQREASMAQYAALKLQQSILRNTAVEYKGLAESAQQFANNVVSWANSIRQNVNQLVPRVQQLMADRRIRVEIDVIDTEMQKKLDEAEKRVNAEFADRIRMARASGDAAYLKTVLELRDAELERARAGIQTEAAQKRVNVQVEAANKRMQQLVENTGRLRDLRDQTDDAAKAAEYERIRISESRAIDEIRSSLEDISQIDMGDGTLFGSTDEFAKMVQEYRDASENFSAVVSIDAQEVATRVKAMSDSVSNSLQVLDSQVEDLALHLFNRLQVNPEVLGSWREFIGVLSDGIQNDVLPKLLDAEQAISSVEGAASGRPIRFDAEFNFDSSKIVEQLGGLGEDILQARDTNVLGDWMQRQVEEAPARVQITPEIRNALNRRLEELELEIKAQGQITALEISDDVPAIDAGQVPVEGAVELPAVTIQSVNLNAEQIAVDFRRQVEEEGLSATAVIDGLLGEGVEGALQDQLDQMTGFTINVDANVRNARGGAIQGFASGGHVRGPGTATSDSILSWLSNGEYVMDAWTTRFFGSDFFSTLQKMARGGFGRLRMLRAMMSGGIPGFARGGPAQVQPIKSPLADMAAAFAGSTTVTPSDTINLNLSIGGGTYSVQGPRDQIRGLVDALKSNTRGSRR